MEKDRSRSRSPPRSKDQSPPKKQCKIKYDQMWKECYGPMFKGITKSDKGLSFAFCELCNSHFSIKASGAYDIKKHCGTTKHVNVQKYSAPWPSHIISWNYPLEDYREAHHVQSLRTCWSRQRQLLLLPWPNLSNWLVMMSIFLTPQSRMFQVSAFNSQYFQQLFRE